MNVAIDVPNDSLNFNKDSGNYHSDVNVLCITYKQDDTVGARFCNTLEPDLTKEEWRQFTKQPYRYQNQFDVALAATGSSRSAPGASTWEDLNHPFRLLRILGRPLLSTAWFYRLISGSSIRVRARWMPC